MINYSSCEAYTNSGTENKTVSCILSIFAAATSNPQDKLQPTSTAPAKDLDERTTTVREKLYEIYSTVTSNGTIQ
jgi:hypothetical protein